MDIYAVKMGGSTLVKTKVDEDMGIEIKHGKKKFHVFEDNLGNLVLRSLEGSLVIQPEASDTITLGVG